MDSEHLTPTHAHTHTADKACFTRRGRPQYLPQAVQAWRQKGLGATLCLWPAPLYQQQGEPQNGGMSAESPHAQCRNGKEKNRKMRDADQAAEAASMRRRAGSTTM
eukprot:scaffold10938_cov26-Tisochrysis_lutea.AAC.5